MSEEKLVPAASLRVRRNKTNKQKEIFLDALEKKLGIVTATCAKTGTSRTIFYKWCKDDPVFKQRVDAIQEVVIDFVESKFYKKIEEEADTTAMIFFLKSKGKKRGWNERAEIEFSGNLGLHLTEDERKIYDDADVEKLEKIKEIVGK